MWFSKLAARLRRHDDEELEKKARQQHCDERWFETAKREADRRVEESIRLLKAEAGAMKR